ncbi:MAG TPA: peptidylprolyl isomerase, partial [Niastella sp.]
IKITDREIGDRYEGRKQDFVQATEAIVSMLVFDNRNHAMAGRITLLSRLNKPNHTTGRSNSSQLIRSDSLSLAAAIDVIDTAHLNGILHTDRHRLLQYNERSLPDTVLKVIFNLPVGEMSRPVPFNDRYMVIIKESESGRRLQLLTEVKDILWKEIMEEKCKKKRQEQVKELRETYKLQNNLEEVLSREIQP